MSSTDNLVASLAQKANEKKGRDELARLQTENNKSEKKSKKAEYKAGRKNVYFSVSAQKELASILERDGVGMSPAIQAALLMLSRASDKGREALYKELRISSNFEEF